MLAIVEDASDEINTADEAEERAIEELRRLGNDLLQSRAERKVEQQTALYQKNPATKIHVKKSMGTQSSALLKKLLSLVLPDLD